MIKSKQKYTVMAKTKKKNFHVERSAYLEGVYSYLLVLFLIEIVYIQSWTFGNSNRR